MDARSERLYDPGQSPVYSGAPLPQREPWESFSTWGAPPPPPPPLDSEAAYASPGPPPGTWVAKRPKGVSLGAVLAIVLGSILLCGAGVVVLALVGKSGQVPGQSVDTVPPAPVVTSGTCEKKIIGEYGVVATVRAVNTSDRVQTGTIWVRWPITGEAAQEFTKRVTLGLGEAVEFPVNEKVSAERWFRMGECSYGWTPAG